MFKIGDELQYPGVTPSITLDLKSEYQLPRTIPQLDRLRGLAILLVLLNHSYHVAPRALEGIFRQGWIGVDIFFVISGFLITGILWDTRETIGYFVRFYGRRVLRIWPAYILLLIFAFCIMPLLRVVVGGLILQVPKEPLGLWAYLLMIQNLFASSHGASVILPITWSLAIEEQFYLACAGSDSLCVPARSAAMLTLQLPPGAFASYLGYVARFSADRHIC